MLRPTLLRFYACSTEHTRRLASVQANAKFCSAAAGPDSGDLNVSSLKIMIEGGEGGAGSCLMLHNGSC